MKIFSFPVLVHDEIVKQLEPVELFSLSLCSKKAHTFVKYYAKIKDVEIREYSLCGLRFPGRQPIALWADSERGLYLDILNLESLRLNLETPKLKTHGSFKMLVDSCRNVYTYWEDAEKGCQELVTYICDLFKVPISTVAIYYATGGKVLYSIQKGQEQKLKNVTIFGSDISADDYSITMRCNATEKLEVWSKAPRGYRFNGTLPPMKTLQIHDAFWVTREHLLGLHSQNVELWDTELTTMDVSALLRSWLSGGLPNLKFLQLSHRDLPYRFDEDLRELFEAFQKTISYKWHKNFKAHKFLAHSFYIRRDDSVVATIQIDYTFFFMAIWPDINGIRP